MSRYEEIPQNDELRRKVLEASCDALESGQYPQDRHALRTNNGWCCLGVITEQARLLNVIAGEWREATQPAALDRETERTIYGFVVGDDEYRQTLPDALAKFLNIDIGGGIPHTRRVVGDPMWTFETGSYYSLASANDSGVPFPAIAAAIRVALLQPETAHVGGHGPSETDDVVF